MESNKSELVHSLEASLAYANANVDVTAFERMAQRWTVIAGAVGTLLTWLRDPSSLHWVLVGLATTWAGFLFPMVAGALYSRKLLQELRKRYD